ncbi:hypothetical protein MNEG_8973 [Monoraphidium neglectum]|uniref:Uncharacterized protein n=1 Tax=Monoraphidium neglectum TaxID=145388 RepID=A0A0D2ME01_9CHLO|nr:hypothetical protein MNEG_8973 [Monoraphidium neglectum]KIY98986.1 hypothetical protein MNEG_8973 [Monoraphidium neglectum]|eukprot:XP_013898006.1 hypothetical protein MNEG_8973 [Monoraphidium neglectum]
MPAAARAAIEWAWEGHFSLFARDVAYAVEGPGDADSRACLLESLLRFTAGCAMTDTALHLLHACVRGGVIALVAPGPPRAFAFERAVRAAGVGGIGFVAASCVGDLPGAPRRAAAAAAVGSKAFPASAARGGGSAAPPAAATSHGLPRLDLRTCVGAGATPLAALAVLLLALLAWLVLARAPAAALA